MLGALAALTLSLFACTAPAAAQCNVTKLEPLDLSGLDGFGSVVDISGDIAVANAPAYSDPRVYVFARSGGSWTQVARIERPNINVADVGFAGSVAIDGSRIVVTGRNPYTGGFLYVFERSGSTWSLSSVLQPMLVWHPVTLMLRDHYVGPVAVSGDTIVVGGRLGWPFTAEGWAFVFDKRGGEWRQTGLLRASDSAAFDSFGGAVAVDGDRIAIGADQLNNGPGCPPGSAYVFGRGPSGWRELARLPDPGSQCTGFGASIDIAGTRVVVGAPAGSAHLFDRTPAGWVQVHQFDPPAPLTQFGRSVALTVDRVLIGAPTTSLPASARGAAFLYTPSASGWSLGARLTSNDPTSAYFGWSVALDASGAFVGDALENLPGVDSGAAYLFDAPCP